MPGRVAVRSPVALGLGPLDGFAVMPAATLVLRVLVERNPVEADDLALAHLVAPGCRRAVGRGSVRT